MAASIALRKILSSAPLKLNNYPCVFRALNPSVSGRLFNTNASRLFDDDDSQDDDRAVVRHRSTPRNDFLSDAFDPFYSTRSLSQVLNMMDHLMENPFNWASRGPGLGPMSHRSWDAKETKDALHLRVDMPGLGKEDIKVSVENNTLVIKGEAVKEPGHEEEEEASTTRKYSSRIELPEKVFRTDGIKAEMKNGVLRVVVPKVKEVERSDVFDVKVE